MFSQQTIREHSCLQFQYKNIFQQIYSRIQKLKDNLEQKQNDLDNHKKEKKYLKEKLTSLKYQLCNSNKNQSELNFIGNKIQEQKEIIKKENKEISSNQVQFEKNQKYIDFILDVIQQLKNQVTCQGTQNKDYDFDIKPVNKSDFIKKNKKMLQTKNLLSNESQMQQNDESVSQSKIQSQSPTLIINNEITNMTENKIQQKQDQNQSHLQFENQANVIYIKELKMPQHIQKKKYKRKKFEKKSEILKSMIQLKQRSQSIERQYKRQEELNQQQIIAKSGKIKLTQKNNQQLQKKITYTFKCKQELDNAYKLLEELKKTQQNDKNTCLYDDRSLNISNFKNNSDQSRIQSNILTQNNISLKTSRIIKYGNISLLEKYIGNLIQLLQGVYDKFPKDQNTNTDNQQQQEEEEKEEEIVEFNHNSDLDGQQSKKIQKITFIHFDQYIIDIIVTYLLQNGKFYSYYNSFMKINNIRYNQKEKQKNCRAIKIITCFR
ncbi:hypothetical protein PPERSA_05502 [Pseudocohnilembus persalinus]|uniref:Uncharacterized protein n=1 Tax=Pseudocohnilembus persalinus TaxID=266149 RepID=A0A0V0QCZ2_PSEPJ|nr:hypothetical protein PPERSA_05502 [Pseudocohnilembus persalinus]|eukprot:KRW99999.1 hypothetical protein PPERSA_05502 [Pseudocohnilembus persalinus]